MNQFFLFYGECGFILVCVVNVAFQVDDISQRGECNVAENTLHIFHIAVLTIWLVFALIVIYGCVQIADALFHACYIDFLIYFQYFFEETQIDILQFHEIAVFVNYSKLT